MVLQSNTRLRAAKRTEGQSYVMGGKTFAGSANKAGTGRSATTLYNVKFLKDMGACCKPGFSDEAIHAIALWKALENEYNELKIALGIAVDQDNWATTGGGIAANNQSNKDFAKVTQFTAYADASTKIDRSKYVNRSAAAARSAQTKTNLKLIRAAWAGKDTGSPGVNGGIFTAFPKYDSDNKIDTAFPTLT